MSNDTELVVLFALLHLVGVAVGGVLLLFALLGGDRPGDARHEPGGGHRPPDPPKRPIGGPPLPGAAPARVRLREPARLTELLPPPPRRGTREPKPTAPRRVPTPTRPRP